MLKPSLHLHSLQLKRAWAIASRLGQQGLGIARKSQWLLKLEDESGAIGYGETSPVSTYGESLLSVLKFLRQLDFSALSFDSLPQSLNYLHSFPDNPAARSLVDLALIDGASKKTQTPITRLLNISTPNPEYIPPPTSFSIGIADPEQTAAAARESIRFRIIKLKAGTQELTATLRAFRSVRPDAILRIDGNEAWSSREIALKQIETALRFGPIEFFEQPMPRHASLEDLIWLKERSPIPLVADESFSGEDDLERCAAGFHGINLKLVKSGGLSPAAKLIQRAQAHKLDILLGCMIEGSLGIAAALHLAPAAKWIDLDGALLTANDPFTGVSENLGQLTLTRPRPFFGLGATPHQNLWNAPPPAERPIEQRSSIPFTPEVYGYSANRITLEVYLPSSGTCDVLLFASIHGEESETTALLSKALRSLDALPPRCACVLNANPDGTLLGTRCNARGVELNRNFPSSNWSSKNVSAKWAPTGERVTFSTGSHPASEPETVAMIDLVQTLQPKTIIALHAPLACIEDPDYSPLGYRIAKATKLPLVGNIGYETPGSFGSWAKENGFHVITYELPPVSVSATHETHLKVLVELLRFGLAPVAKRISNAV